MARPFCSVLSQAEQIPLPVRCENLLKWLESDPQFAISPNIRIHGDMHGGVGLFYARGESPDHGNASQNNKSSDSASTCDSAAILSNADASGSGNSSLTSQPALHIPARFLLNKLTCVEFLRGSGDKSAVWHDLLTKKLSIELIEETLNSFQVIILFIYIEWFCSDSDSFFLPFFQSLPSCTFFEENVPVLQYLELGDSGEIVRENMNVELKVEFEKLLENYSETERALLPILNAYHVDLNVTKRRIRYLYMCINSRCLYYEIKRNNATKEDNLTLVPLVDFINHTNDESARNSYVEVTKSINLRAQSYRLFVQNEKMQLGENELLFKYGPHSDCLLLNDYGFILAAKNSNNYHDVTEIILRELRDCEVEYLKSIKYHDSNSHFLISSDSENDFFNTQLAIFIISLNLDFPNLNRLAEFPKPKQMRLNNFIRNMEPTKNYRETLARITAEYNQSLGDKVRVLQALPQCPRAITDLMEKYYIHEGR